jgi:hypothetical protein
MNRLNDMGGTLRMDCLTGKQIAAYRCNHKQAISHK